VSAAVAAIGLLNPGSAGKIGILVANVLVVLYLAWRVSAKGGSAAAES
jgi:hypothetical protein